MKVNCKVILGAALSPAKCLFICVESAALWNPQPRGLDALNKCELSCPCRESDSYFVVFQPVDRHYSDWAMLAPRVLYCKFENEVQIYTDTGRVARMEERRGAYRVLVRKPEGRRPLGRPRRIWEDNIKMDIWEVGWGHGMDRFGSE